MEKRDVIGIDPDSRQIVCVMVPEDGSRNEVKTFDVTEAGLKSFIGWVNSRKEAIIAIEGSNGQSRPIEKALRTEKLSYYSFKPADVERERKSQLGNGKNNEKDALAVALLAKNRENSGQLEKWRRVFPVDRELQSLTRFDEKIARKMNCEISELWKELREASPDIYLFISGKHGDWEQTNNILDSAGILNLLTSNPDLTKWKNMSHRQIWNAMGAINIRGRDDLIKMLIQVSAKTSEGSVGQNFLIQEIAGNIMRCKNQRKEVQKLIEQIAEDRSSIKLLLDGLTREHSLKGISIITAAKIIAEVVDIRRFVREDSLAQYAGLGLVESETGKRDNGRKPKMVRTSEYNRRLKNTMLTAARNLVKWNPHHRLTGMFKDYIKKGMSYLEALKRVARSLNRIVYKILKSENQEIIIDSVNKEGTVVAKMGKTRRIKSASNTYNPLRKRIAYSQGICQNKIGKIYT
jgi:hypothetical protein